MGCILFCFFLRRATSQPLLLFVPQGKGSAAASPAGSNVTYEYVDLWSRRTTWGGLEPPVFNDSVVIHAGTTVMLDVSPPKLYMLLIEVGTLQPTQKQLFCVRRTCSTGAVWFEQSSRTAELHLQLRAHHSLQQFYHLCTQSYSM